MQRPRAGITGSLGFERTFERHLVVQQRKAVLDALASKIDPDATVGEVLEAAEALGWSDSMGELSLADLADALLSDGTTEDEEAAAAPLDDAAAEADADEDLEDEALEEDEDEALADEVETHARTKKKTGKKTAKTAGKKKTAKTAGKKTTKKVGKKTAKTAGKKTAKKAASVTPPSSKKKAKKGTTGAKKAGAARMRALRQKLEADEPMSLDEAAEVFLPLVERFDNATMQDLEEATGVGRRKLRFHIGQLVRHDYLERHGMGRGTYYTVAR